MSLIWEKKKLEEVCHKIFAGGDKPKDHFSNTKSNFFSIPVVSNGVKNNGISGYTNLPTVSQEAITVSARGTIGFTVHRKYPFVPIVRLIVLIPNQEHISCEYIYYYLKSIDIDRTGTSIPQLTVPMIKKYSIPTPPLPEQKKIVETLDKAFKKIDKAIANVERNIQNAEELFQSKLNQIFSPNGDNLTEEPLAEVFLFRQGIQRSVKLQSEIMGEDQVRFLRIVDYTQGNEPPRYIDNPGNDYIVGVEDISLVRYGASTGFVCRGYDGALANNLFRVIPRENYTINLSYLYYYLLSPVFQGFIKRKMTGAAMPAISFSMIKNIPFKYLKVNTQQNIAETLNVMDNHIQSLLASYKKELKILEELKKSILEKAFKGELTSAA